MKKRMLKLIACTAIMAMALSVTACGGTDKEDKTAEETAAGDDADGAEAAGDKDTAGADDVDADNADAAGTEDTDGADNADAAGTEDTDGADNADAAGTEDTDGADNADAADGNAAAGTTLEELFEDPTAKSAFDSMVQAMATDGMSASVSAVGNEMIVEVKYEDSSLITDGISEALDTALDTQADTFKAQVKTLDDTVGQAGACTFTVRYLDPDGNVLTEKSFKAE